MPNKILLIEDDRGITMALTDLLNAEDYRVETAADGLTGLARALEGNFDVIILDVMLPGKNGFDVCRDLRQRSITTPILMLTARGQVIDKVLGLKLGADDYLCKPNRGQACDSLRLDHTAEQFPEFVYDLQEQLGWRLVLLAELASVERLARAGTIPLPVADRLTADMEDEMRRLGRTPTCSP